MLLAGSFYMSLGEAHFALLKILEEAPQFASASELPEIVQPNQNLDSARVKSRT